MGMLQSLVQNGRRVVPRGWAPVLRLAARINPALRAYPARLASGDHMLLDLRQSMCLGIFFDGAAPHNQGLDRLMEQTLESGSVFVDVGASIGYYTRLARKLVGHAGGVHAFEPLPSALPILTANTGAFENVFVHSAAVGREMGTIDFYARAMGDTSSVDPDPDAESIRVRMTTLDEALRDVERLDLLKIDVEGFELEVLQGAMEILRTHQPVVHFEFLTTFSETRGLTLHDYENLLEPLGYDLFWSNHSPDGPPVVSGPPSSDVVAVPPRWMKRVSPE